VDTCRVGNRTRRCERRSIENFHVRAVGDEQPRPRGVEGQVIPAFGSWKLDLPRQVIRNCRCRHSGQEDCGQGARCDRAFQVHELSPPVGVNRVAAST
jgi:hypothetical protein